MIYRDLFKELNLSNVESLQNNLLKRSFKHSIANSSLFPTSLYLHSNSTQILALKKMVFLKKKSSHKK